MERGVLMDPVCGRFNTPDLHKPINQYINIRLKDNMSEKNGGKILKSGKKNIKKSKKWKYFCIFSKMETCSLLKNLFVKNCSLGLIPRFCFFWNTHKIWIKPVKWKLNNNKKMWLIRPLRGNDVGTLQSERSHYNMTTRYFFRPDGDHNMIVLSAAPDAITSSL